MRYKETNYTFPNYQINQKGPLEMYSIWPFFCWNKNKINVISALTKNEKNGSMERFQNGNSKYK